MLPVHVAGVHISRAVLVGDEEPPQLMTANAVDSRQIRPQRASNIDILQLRPIGASAQ
jgi:hypothetical protein